MDLHYMKERLNLRFFRSWYHCSRKLAKYDFSKLNLTESITLEQVTEEIRVLQEELGCYLEEYEELARRLETFVKILDTHKHIYFNVQGDIYLE